MKFIKYFGIILLMFFWAIPYTNASQGCCSWHGGISNCGANGYYICNDGTQSPSCRCTMQETTEDSCNYNEYISQINVLNYEKDTLEQELNDLNKENQELNTSKNNYQTLFIVSVIIFVIYYYGSVRNSV